MTWLIDKGAPAHPGKEAVQRITSAARRILSLLRVGAPPRPRNQHRRIGDCSYRATESKALSRVGPSRRADRNRCRHPAGNLCELDPAQSPSTTFASPTNTAIGQRLRKQSWKQRACGRAALARPSCELFARLRCLPVQTKLRVMRRTLHS